MSGQLKHESTPEPLRLGWPGIVAAGASGCLGSLLAPHVVTHFGWEVGAKYWVIGLLTAVSLAALLPLLAVIQRR
jgi:hypothetical protein